MIPLVSNHIPLFNLLKERFPPKPITPKSDMNEVLYIAGQLSVIAFMEAQLKEEEERQLQFE